MAQTKAARKAAMARKQAARKTEGVNYVGRVFHLVCKAERWNDGGKVRPHVVVDTIDGVATIVPFSTTHGAPIFVPTATNGISDPCDLRPDGLWTIAIGDLPRTGRAFGLAAEEIELVALRLEEG